MGIELPDASDVDAAIGHWRDADARFAAFLERYGDAPRALRHYGLVLWEDGVPQSAAGVLTAAVSLAPSDAKLWTDLAGALNAAGQLRQAEACMEEALLRDKMQAQGWLRLGSIRGALEDHDGAEQALKTALALDSTLVDARLSLGLLFFHARRFEEAAESLRTAIQATMDPGPAVIACYGQTLGHLGHFASATEALRIAVGRDPDNAVVVLKLAQVQFIADLIAGRTAETATRTCRAMPFVTADAFETISRQSFHQLVAFGHRDAALRLCEARLNARPADAESRYLHAVLKGDALSRAPDAYIASFFDQFADDFDKQLVGVLGYKAFEQLATLTLRHATSLDHMLDLGCGTGLSGPLLAAPGRHLVGLDLSPGMLDKARQRQCYDMLIEGEAVTYLQTREMAFDLIFAADVLIYVGDLAMILRRAFHALKPGGLFAFTLETSEQALDLLPTGRFAHGLRPTLDLSVAAGFTTVATDTIDVRYETHGFVAGASVVLRRS